MSLGYGLILLIVLLSIALAWYLWRRSERRSGVTTAILVYNCDDPASARMQDLFAQARKALRRQRTIVCLDFEFESNRERAEELGVTQAQVPALVCRCTQRSGDIVRTSTIVCPPIRDLEHMITLITSFKLFLSLLNR